jgi:glutathione S-transferase
MYILHIANKNYSSWSLRPWILLKALNIPFTEKLHPFPENSAWDLYRKFAPNGKVPCLHDGETAVWDSLAIVEYVAEQYPSVWPSDKQARAWARSATAEMHSGFQTLRNDCGMNCGIRIQLNNISAALQKDITRIDELWAEGLKKFGGPFLAGSTFTAVDAFFVPVVFRFQTYNLPTSTTAKSYIETILKLPAVQEWYEAALLEHWREHAHEQETLGAGTLIVDHRK